MDRSTFRSHADKSELLGRTIEMNRCDFVAIIRRKIVFKERPRPTLPGETPSKSTGKQKILLKYA